MKKLSKLMALLLSLLMILSLFTACGDSKKDDEKEENLTGKDLLIGNWDAEFVDSEDYITYTMKFKDDGTGEIYLTEANYEAAIEEAAKYNMDILDEEELAEEGIETLEDCKAVLREETPYEEIASDIESSFTWELDGDTLTIEAEDGDIATAETKLSEGKKSMTFVDEQGNEIKLTK